MNPAPTPDAARRRRTATLAGHTGDTDVALAALDDADAGVRSAALGAVCRLNMLDSDVADRLVSDTDAGVRRRLAEELGRRASRPADPVPADPVPADPTWELPLVDRLIDDPDHSVAEAATWAAGELFGADNRVAPPGEHDPALVAMVAKLSGNARHHDDALVREASVAALGSIGHRDGLDAVLAATADKPAVRRRAVIALAAFLGDPGVDEALTGATKDRDWQVRQAARILLDLPSEPE